jgi:uncharacterized membrane protein
VNGAFLYRNVFLEILDIQSLLIMMAKKLYKKIVFSLILNLEMR